MDTPWVVLEEFCYTFPALLIHCLDVASNSVRGWDLEMRVSCCEEVDKLRVRNNVYRAITFCDPFCNMGAV